MRSRTEETGTEVIVKQVLNYARSIALAKPTGVPGETLLRFAGLMPLDDLEEMERAIEEGCEQIDLSQW